MRDFHCRDAGQQCDFVARGRDDREVLDLARRHAEEAHHIRPTEEVVEQMARLIHEEDSDAHRHSMGALIP
jgi:predicted small metal-binding protein